MAGQRELSRRAHPELSKAQRRRPPGHAGWGGIEIAAAEGATAAADAVRLATRRLDGANRLTLLFSSQIDPALAAQSAADAGAGAPLVGLTTAGCMHSDGAIETGAVAVCFGSDYDIGVGSAGAVGKSPRLAAANATRRALDAIEASRQPHRLLILLSDPDSGDPGEAVGGAYSAAGSRVPIVGGTAAGPVAVPLLGSRRRDDTIVAVAIASPRPIAVADAHSCAIIGLPGIVTRSEGPLIREIDGEPALDVYLRAHAGSPEMDDRTFEAFAATRPLAQREIRRTHRIRRIRSRVGKALLCTTRIPTDAGIEFAIEQPTLSEAASIGAVREAVLGLRANPARAIVVFSNVARRIANGGGNCEVAAISSILPGETSFAGAYTGGEFARTRGAKGDLSHAIAVACFA